MIQRFYGARSGAKKTESFGYVQGGYASILSNLEKRLDEREVLIRTNQRIGSVTRESGHLTVESNGERAQFDKALITIPSNSIAKICPALDPDEKQSHSDLQYQGVICVSLLLREPLGGAYLTYITERGLPFTTIIEMTTLVDRDQYQGLHLVYLPKYIPAEHKLFAETDENITAEFICGLQKMFPAFSADQIVCTEVSRARQVTTIPTLAYSAKIPNISTSIPGLFISNSAQITNAALSVDESVQLANNTIEFLLRDA